jgi:alkanesulfonate monooxygenase SsuD/methylene tetrahydromethanopterin reductase-like flavin-dependent oxidoreductase (luciferase family)
MKIGIGLPNVVPGTQGRELVHWARRAEKLGVDSLAVIDRVVYDSYEPLITLAMAAAVTERVELVTNVVIAPLRGTHVLAKQAASLDRASGGRLTLGLALGARDDDFTACGLAPRDRGRMLEAQLTELRRIWNAAGSAGGIGPMPATPSGPRLLIGGDARYAARRAAMHGDGWTMMVGSPEEFAAGVEATRRAWQAAGRDGEPRTMAVFYGAVGGEAVQLIDSAVGGYYAWLGPEIARYIVGSAARGAQAITERVVAFADAGADDVIVVPCSADPAQLEGLAGAALRARTRALL